MMQPTGNATFDAAVIAAEVARQAAVNAAGASQTTINSAQIVFYKAIIQSAVNNSVDIGPFIHALRNLGTAV